jgi:hypothetical protein
MSLLGPTIFGTLLKVIQFEENLALLQLIASLVGFYLDQPTMGCTMKRAQQIWQYWGVVTTILKQHKIH